MPGKKEKKEGSIMKSFRAFWDGKVLLSLFCQQYEGKECLKTILGYVSAGKLRILSAGISRERAMTFTLSKKQKMYGCEGPMCHNYPHL